MCLFLLLIDTFQRKYWQSHTINMSNPNNNLLIASPLDQFEIRNFLSLEAPILGNLHIFLSNIAFYLTIAALITYLVNLLARNHNIIVANA